MIGSRHVWIVLLLVVAACILALCGRSASAQLDRVEETIEKALALEPDPSAGGRLYRQHCSSCHGRNAGGNSQTVVPALAGQVAPYLIKQLADLVEGYRDLPEMHRQVARTDLVTPQAMHDLAAFLSALPLLTDPQLGEGKHLVLGGRIYKSVCADCHGARGEGDERNRTPALRGQHYSYLLRQARQLAAGHRYSVDISVIVLLEALTLDQLTAVADFISRLPASAEAETLAGSVGNSLGSARAEHAICARSKIRIDVEDMRPNVLIAFPSRHDQIASLAPQDLLDELAARRGRIAAAHFAGREDEPTRADGIDAVTCMTG